MMYYAVKIGKVNNQIYDNWNDCQKNVSGVSGAIFKKFSTREEALNFINEIPNNKVTTTLDNKLIAYVDGSYNTSTKETGYGIVFTRNNEIICRDFGRILIYGDNTINNVLGELMGALKATELAVANNYEEIIIAHDYLGVSAWVTGEWTPKMKITKKYKKLMNHYLSKIHIDFLKIKAHSSESDGGSVFNHEADRLAKLASGIL